MTPHIEAKLGEIAKTVIMPGCPVRAKAFAEKFLDNPKLVNTVRNVNMYTGTYQGKPVSICASGMGMSSMGIYSYELFKFYDVDNIIRVGTCGAYSPNLNLGDLFVVEESFTLMPGYMQIMTDERIDLAEPSRELNARLEESANKQGIKYTKGRCHTSCIFYDDRPIDKLYELTKADVVEMETFALFVNAKLLKKHAASLLTVSDTLVVFSALTAEERVKCADNAIKVVLGIL